MIKLVLVGVWACLVVVGAAYASVSLRLFEPGKEKHAESKLEMLNMKPVSVPVVREDRIEGYLVIRLSIVVDAALRKSMIAKVEDLVADEVLRSSIGTSLVRFPAELAGLPATVVKAVNQRVNAGVLSQIVVQEWSYAGRSDLRK